VKTIIVHYKLIKFQGYDNHDIKNNWTPQYGTSYLINAIFFYPTMAAMTTRR